MEKKEATNQRVHWKASVIWQDQVETHDFSSYYEVLHFIFDVIVFRIRKQNIIIKLEVQDETEIG